MDVPDNVIHFLLAAAIPSIGGLFIFLLKRTFKDFEDKVGELFGQLKESLKQQQDHETRIQLLEREVTRTSRRKR